MEHKETEIAEWPLWRITLRELRQLEGFGYGLKVPMEWFEKRLALSSQSDSFAFAMLDLRSELEAVDGYYLQCRTIQDDETFRKRQEWQIPSAQEHGEISSNFEHRMNRLAQRALSLRLKTLSNESADLTAGERTRMDGGARIAAYRVLFLQREQDMYALVEKHKPELLS